jgi:hypothetical protein
MQYKKIDVSTNPPSIHSTFTFDGQPVPLRGKAHIEWADGRQEVVEFHSRQVHAGFCLDNPHEPVYFNMPCFWTTHEGQAVLVDLHHVLVGQIES